MFESLQQISEYLKDFLKNDETITTVYLFGSALRKDYSERSDLDLAFLINEITYAKDPFESISPAYMAATEISTMLRRKTDVTILNGSSIEMAYNIITSGQCIFEVDKESRIEYEIKIKGMYFDFFPFIKELRKQKLENLIVN